MREILADGTYSIAELRAGGYQALDMRASGVTGGLRTAAYTCGELKAAGYGVADLLSDGFGVPELISHHFSLRDYRDARVPPQDVCSEGAKRVAGGWSLAQLHASGLWTPTTSMLAW